MILLISLLIAIDAALFLGGAGLACRFCMDRLGEPWDFPASIFCSFLWLGFIIQCNVWIFSS